MDSRLKKFKQRCLHGISQSSTWLRFVTATTWQTGRRWLGSPATLWLMMIVLWLISTRVFFSRDFDAVGHNWDWSFPASSSLLARFNILSWYAWKRLDLGYPDYLSVVHLVPNTLVAAAAYVLPVKWVIYSILTSVWVASLIGMKRLLDYGARRRQWHYVPALLYAFSPFLFNDIIGGSWVMWISYAAAPFYFRAAMSFMTTGRLVTLVHLAVATIFLLSSIQNFVLLNLLVAAYSLFLLGRGELRWRQTGGRFVIVVSIFVILNLYWALGFIQSLREFIPGVVLNDTVAVKIEHVINSQQDIFHILTLSGYVDRNMYWHVLPALLRGGVVVGAAIVWLIIGLHISKRRQGRPSVSLFWLGALLLLILLIKGGNQPLANFTIWLYETFPGLRLYRSPQHLMLVPAFIIPILMSTLMHGVTSRPWRRLYSIVSALAVVLWISGWWYTGDLGHQILLQQARDHVDYYQVPPDLAQVYEDDGGESRPHRTLFLPAVFSPQYVANKYQRSAQGGIPEYTFLKHPTLTTERSLLAEFVDTALCTGRGENFPWKNFLALLNVQQVVVRSDILPMHTACKDKWDSQRVHQTLDQADGLTLASTGAVTQIYTLAEQFFRPLIYTPASLIFTTAAVTELPELVTQDSISTSAFIFADSAASLPVEVAQHAQTMGEAAVVAFDQPIAHVNLPPPSTPGTAIKLQRDVKSDDMLHVRYDAERAVIVAALVEQPLEFNAQPLNPWPEVEVPAAAGDVVMIGETLIKVGRELEKIVPYAAMIRVFSVAAPVLQDSFEEGELAQDAFANCSAGQAAGPELSYEFTGDAAEGEKALSLRTDGTATACWRRAYPLSLRPTGFYLASLAVRNRAGGIAQFYAEVGREGRKESEVNRQLVLENDRWQSVLGLLRVEEETDNALLYVYAPENKGQEVINDFDGFSLAPLVLQQTVKFSPPQQDLPPHQVARGALNELRPVQSVAADTSLLEAASFEEGSWEKEPTDCASATSGTRENIWLQWLAGATDGKRAVRLGARDGHVACIHKRFAADLDPQLAYKLSFDYRTHTALPGQFSYQTLAPADALSKELAPTDGEWQHYDTVVSLSKPSNFFQLYMYAPSMTGESNEVDYDNIRLVPWVPKALTRYRLAVSSLATKSLNNPEDVVIQAVNPTRYLIHVTNGKRFPLVFSEAFNAGWRLYPRSTSDQTLRPVRFWETWFTPAIAAQSHFMVNGYANGWWLDLEELCLQRLACDSASGGWSTEFVLDFWPQRLFYVGLLGSSPAWAGLLGYAAWQYAWRQRWRQTLAVVAVVVMKGRRLLPGLMLSSLGVTFGLVLIGQSIWAQWAAVTAYLLLGATVVARLTDIWHWRGKD